MIVFRYDHSFFWDISDNIASRIEINSELVSSPNPHNMAQAVWQEILCVSPASLSKFSLLFSSIVVALPEAVSKDQFL